VTHLSQGSEDADLFSIVTQSCSPRISFFENDSYCFSVSGGLGFLGMCAGVLDCENWIGIFLWGGMRGRVGGSGFCGGRGVDERLP